MSRRGRAFTLVELLVVTAIMATFFALIVTAANPGSGSQVRQAAQSLASALTAAQSRALGNPAGAAVILESGTVAGASLNICVAAYHADSPPLITGTTTTAGLPFPAGAASASITLVPDNGDAEDLVSGYKVQFGGAAVGAVPYQPPSDWFSLACPSASGGSASCTVGFRTTDGQTALNTIWPLPTKSNPLVFRAARYPAKGVVAVQCGKSAGIDLRFSGIGDDPTTTWGGLAGKGSLAITFDSLGGVDVLMQQVLKTGSRTADPSPVHPVEPIYFFVASRSVIDNATVSSLSDQQAIWVVVHPQTGRVTIAANVPQAGSNATALRAARAKARAGVSFGK